jgi:hypothetical protein
MGFSSFSSLAFKVRVCRRFNDVVNCSFWVEVEKKIIIFEKIVPNGIAVFLLFYFRRRIIFSSKKSGPMTKFKYGCLQMVSIWFLTRHTRVSTTPINGQKEFDFNFFQLKHVNRKNKNHLNPIQIFLILYNFMSKLIVTKIRGRHVNLRPSYVKKKSGNIYFKKKKLSFSIIK